MNEDVKNSKRRGWGTASVEVKSKVKEARDSLREGREKKRRAWAGFAGYPVFATH